MGATEGCGRSWAGTRLRCSQVRRGGGTAVGEPRQEGDPGAAWGRGQRTADAQTTPQSPKDSPSPGFSLQKMGPGLRPSPSSAVRPQTGIHRALAPCQALFQGSGLCRLAHASTLARGDSGSPILRMGRGTPGKPRPSAWRRPHRKPRPPSRLTSLQRSASRYPPNRRAWALRKSRDTPSPGLSAAFLSRSRSSDTWGTERWR